MARMLSYHSMVLLLPILVLTLHGRHVVSSAPEEVDMKVPSDGNPNIKTAKILMFPYGHGFSSHIMDFQKIALLLHEEGYDISVLINDHDRVYMEKISNFEPKIIDYPASSDPSYVRLTDDYFRQQFFSQSNTSTISMIKLLAAQQYLACRELLQTQSVLDKIHQERYDLLIVDFTDVCARILVQYFQLPTVVYSGVGLSFDSATFPNLPTIIPTFSTSFTDEMDFWERTQNTLRLVAMRLIGDPHFFDRLDELKNEFLKRDNVPSVRKAFANQLFVAHASWSIDYPRPLLPNVILVGGMHAEAGKPLRSDIEYFVQGAGSAGIVVVSFGSLLGDMDIDKAEEIARALGQLKQRVIWRYSGATKPPSSNTENILILDWIPQNDLLAHERTKVFVSHCGIHSTYEAIQHSVPVVATPVCSDGFENANKLVRRAKMAVTVDMKSLTTESLLTAIHIILNNERYKENAIKASRLLSENPMSARDTFLYYVSYVIRHRGLGALASKPINNLDTYQLYGVDVILFLIFLVGVIVSLTLSLFYFTCKICIGCCKMCLGSKEKVE